MLAEFWADLKQLLAHKNERQVAAGKPLLTQKELAERVNVPVTTFNGWWSKGTVPAEFLPLAQAAGHLDGNVQQWLDRCRMARAAHEALLADGRRNKEPAAPDQRPATAQTPATMNTTMGEQSSRSASQTETAVAAGAIADQSPSPPVTAVTRRRRLSRRSRLILIASAIVLIAAVVPLAWFWNHQSPAPTSQPRPDHTGSGLSMWIVPIPLATLSPGLAAMVAPRQAASGTVNGYVFRNYAGNSLCLSAGTTGPTAGTNRDKIQLAACAATNDEIWIPAQWERSGDKLTWLVSYRYQSKCLNADRTGGINDGRKVQLWNCYNADNESWDFGNWYDQARQGHAAAIHLSVEKFGLDADKYNLGDGDQIVIWTMYGAHNQFWY